MNDFSIWIYVLVPFISAVTGSIIGWWGIYHVQHRLQRYYNQIETLRKNYKDFLKLSVEYWVVGWSREERQVTEARIIIEERALTSEFRSFGDTNRKIRKSFNFTEESRLELMNLATGGSFQQAEWSEDLDRAKSIQKIISKILRELN